MGIIREALGINDNTDKNKYRTVYFLIGKTGAKLGLLYKNKKNAIEYAKKYGYNVSKFKEKKSPLLDNSVAYKKRFVD